MTDKKTWEKISADIKQTQKKCQQEMVNIDNSIDKAFADPEIYGKIKLGDDLGINGLNLAIRKHKDAKDDFNNVFCDRAKRYNACQSNIKAEAVRLNDCFRVASQLAQKYGLRVEH